MKFFVRLLTGILPFALLSFTACAPIETPPPDPTKEQITLLQKQLLELQKIQNDMKVKLEEAAPANLDSMEARLKRLEERQSAPAPVIAEPKPADDATITSKKPAPAKKKPVKKTKKKKKTVKKQPAKAPSAESQKSVQPAAPQQPAGASR